MTRTPKALTEACRAGTGAFLAFLLTSALFVAPFLAAQQNFGHTHPEGTPQHHHALTTVLGHATVAPTVTSVALSFGVCFFLASLYTSLVLASFRDPAHGVRAPPLLSL